MSRSVINVLMVVTAVVGAGDTRLWAQGNPGSPAYDDIPPLPSAVPPPLAPPPPPLAPPLRNGAADGGGQSSGVNRYQECLQRMIDQGMADNAFIKRCMGLPTRANRLPNGELEAVGKLEATEVIQAGLAGLKECYERFLAQAKAFGQTPEGTLETKVDFTGAGKVEGVAFDSGGLSDLSLLGCSRDKLKTWIFPRSAVEHQTLRFSVKLAARKGSGPPKATLVKNSVRLTTGGAGAGGATGTVSQSEALAVFRKNISKVRACYDEFLVRRPGFSAKVQVELGVNGRGQVTQVGLTEFAGGDEAFRACVTGQFMNWRFARLHAGEAAVVRYPPLVFNPRRSPPPPLDRAPAGDDLPPLPPRH